MGEPPGLRLVALVAFVGTYLGLGLGRVPGFPADRTGIAIIGAAVVVVGGVFRWDQAVAAVDARTLVVLFGMMVVGAYLRLSVRLLRPGDHLDGPPGHHSSRASSRPHRHVRRSFRYRVTSAESTGARDGVKSTVSKFTT